VNAGTVHVTATTALQGKTARNVLAQKIVPTTVLAAKVTVPVTQGGEVLTAPCHVAQKIAPVTVNAK
jgi:hypothetical protein